MTIIPASRVIEAANAAGSRFFAPGTVRFFQSRTCKFAYEAASGERFFVTSEKPLRGPRLWTVRRQSPDGHIHNAEEFYMWPTRRAAVAEAKRRASAD